jgi:hypothetical protein
MRPVADDLESIPFPGAEVGQGFGRRDVVDRAWRTGFVIELIVPQVNLKPKLRRRPVRGSVNQDPTFIPAERLVFEAEDKILLGPFSPEPGGVRRSAG